MLAYSGKGHFFIESTDLSTLIREMADLLTVTINKDHDLGFFFDDNLPTVLVDRTQIRQVVMNLIINASEAITHREGVIKISTGTQYCDVAELDGAKYSGDIQPGDYAFVEISDNGTGIDAEVLDRIYDPFFTTKFTGRGLGLAAALGTARGHDGVVKVYSEVGRGTKFKLLLPISEVVSNSREPALIQHPEWSGSGGVLIIDDESAVREFACSVLEQHGYQIYLASDGAEGLALYQANQDKISMVLLDLTMPNLGGKETYAGLKTLKPDICTVLMSGYNEQDATRDFVGEGLARFLAKPFLVEELMAAIIQALAVKPAS